MRLDLEPVMQSGHDGGCRPKLIGDGKQAVFLVDVAVGKKRRQIRKPKRSRPILQPAPIWFSNGKLV